MRLPVVARSPLPVAVCPMGTNLRLSRRARAFLAAMLGRRKEVGGAALFTRTGVSFSTCLRYMVSLFFPLGARAGRARCVAVMTPAAVASLVVC